MKIKNIEIIGIGGIETVELNFNDNINLICGPNGIGKTTIIETIAHIFFNGNTSILKRNVNSQKSIIRWLISINGNPQKGTINFNNFVPDKDNNINGLSDLSKKFISFKTTRTFKYYPLSSITKDSIRDNYECYHSAKDGINLTEIKNWFVNRYLYSAHGVLTIEQLNNFKLAKKCFSLLNSSYGFSKVDATTNEIMVSTPSGEIYYEYLSSGFKSILSLCFGIIKEIEFRFKENKLNAIDFDGIITIDEIELHLHPEWQGKITNILSKLFPKTHFFITTHSPHVIQNAEPKQIIALGFVDKSVKQLELPENDYGFKGWSIEEVLTDVMGMTNTRTQFLRELLEKFGNEIDCENYVTAKDIFKEINLLLHPNNELRKLLKFQLASINYND